MYKFEFITKEEFKKIKKTKQVFYSFFKFKKEHNWWAIENIHINYFDKKVKEICLTIEKKLFTFNMSDINNVRFFNCVNCDLKLVKTLEKIKQLVNLRKL